MLKKISLTPFIVITFLLFIVVPSKVPAVLKFPLAMGLGALCVLFELISLFGLKGAARESKQTIGLIIVTLALMGMYYFIFGG
jgi:hypothetical protein